MPLASGDRLGHYEIVEAIGTGGMGEVYLAHDARLERNVALKVLPEAMAADPAYRRRFETEARAASALSHPNAAHIYDVGEEDGRHFIAMEHVEGETLKVLLGRGALASSRAAELGLQVASALDEAHARGIVHRDIKPGNVIVTKRGDAKVLDFGLARRDSAPDETADSQMSTDLHTQVGAVLGTVPYMSPEQALGKDVDSRTDIFSLGVVLYEMATGRRPFSGSTTTQLIDAICHGEPEPLSAARAASPAELDRIISKCLAKDPDARYATARDLVVDLRALHKGLESGSVAALARSPRPSRSWRLLAAAVVVLAAGAFAVWSGLPSAGAAIDSIAVLPFDNTTDDVEVGYLSDGLSEALINSLSQLPDVRVISRSSAVAAAAQSDDPREIGAKLGVRALVMGRVSQRGDRVVISSELIDVEQDRQLWGDRFERSLNEVSDVERELATVILARLKTRLSAEDLASSGRGTTDATAYQLYNKGRHFIVGTTAEMDMALEAFEEAARLDPEYALAHAAIGESLVNRIVHGVADPASAAPAARAAVDRALALDPELPEAHSADALLRLWVEWDLRGAERAFDRALELAPSSAPVYLEYAVILWVTGRNEEALAASRRALELDPLGRMPMHNIGISHLFARDYEAAAAAFVRALEVHPSWIWGHVKLAVSHAFAGRAEEALVAAAKAEDLFPEDDNPTLRAWLGVAYGRAGDTGKAMAALDRLKQMRRTQHVDAVDIASVYSQVDAPDSTVEWLEVAFAEHSPWMVAVPPHVFMDRIRDDPRFQSLVARFEAASREAGS